MVRKVKKSWCVDRLKIRNRKIRKEKARWGLFWKLRTGLFEEAKEISILCGAKVAAVAISPTGKPFIFEHPTDGDSIINGFINEEMDKTIAYMESMLEKEKRRREVLEKELKRSEMELSMLDKEEYERRLMELRENLAERVERLPIW